MTRVRLLTLLLLAGLTSCSQSDNETDQTSGAAGENAAAQSENVSIVAADVSYDRLLNAESEPSQWMMKGGTYEERYFSPLDEINRENVGDLDLAWYADYDVNLSQQGTPLYVDGVIYVSTAWSMVNAFDARSALAL